MKYLKRLVITLLIVLLLAGVSVYFLFTHYKKELTAQISETLKLNYGLSLKVENIKVSFLSNWPHASVQLKNVSISNDLYKGPDSTLMKAGSVSLSVNLEKMLHKQFLVRYLTIKDAEVLMLKDELGGKNFVFKNKLTDTLNSPSGVVFEISKITIKNSTFKFVNRQRKQDIHIDFLDEVIRLQHYTDGIEGDLSGKIFVNGLLFNEKKGEFLKRARAEVDLRFSYFKDTKRICIHPPSTIEIEKHQYAVACLLEAADPKRLALLIDSKDIKYEQAARLLTPKIQKVLGNFEVKKSFDATVLLMVNIGMREDPLLVVNVEAQHSDLTIGTSKIPYSDISFKGKIVSIDNTAQRGDFERARISFSQVKGNVYDFPFTATINVNQLQDPQIQITSRLYIEASKIKNTLKKEFIMEGTAVAVINYEGPASKLNKKEFLDPPMRLNAGLTFNDLSYRPIGDKRPYIINGKANLNNRDLRFEKLNLRTMYGEAVLKGKAEDFMNYVLGNSKGFKASVSGSTEKLDLNPFFEVKDSVTAAPVKTNNKTNKVAMQEMAKSQFEFNISLRAKKLVVKKVEARDARIDLFYRNNFLNVRSLNMSTCAGHISAKGSVTDFNKISADVFIQNVDVNELFSQFENFGQDAVVRENLQGTVTVDAKFKAELNENMGIKGETMAGEGKIKLRDGHLINFEPIQNLSNFLFRNRDFNDVSFSELNESFSLNGYEMEIRELEIGSNVLNLYVVDGYYNFKGNSNINILVPWSNLKRRGKNYIPKNSGESAENTKGVKLNFSGPTKKLKISLGHKERIF